MKQLLLLVAFVIGITQATSQTLSEFKTKVDNFGQKPKKKASKKIYINTFNVLVEVYREDVDYKGKREFRGKGRAEAKAEAALGLLGVDGTLLQQKTDKLYNEFVEDLKSKGFEIMTSDQVENTAYYKKAVPFEGPMVRESANPGLLEIIPTNFSGFTSTRNAEGKKSNKEGLFSGFSAVGNLVKNTNVLSKQLDDAIVIDVNLALTWSETGGSWFAGLGAANAQVKTNLALGEKAVSVPKSKGLRTKGAEDYYKIPNNFVLAQGSGLKKVTWTGYLKKPIEIGGVIENTKVQSYNKGNVATSFDVGNMYKVTTWTSSISEEAKFVEVDGEKFSQALYVSGKAFIDDQLNYLFDQYKL